MLTLTGRTAIVDGAGGVIGEEVARQLLLGGMNVVSFNASEEKAEIIRNQFSDYADHLWACGGRNRPKIAEVYERFGSMDVLICLQGQPPCPADIEDIPMPLWERAGESLINYYMEITDALPFLRKSKAPRIILHTSTEARGDVLSEDCLDLAYAACFGGVNAMTVNLARKLAGDGITVNAIEFGACHNASLLPDPFFDRYGRPDYQANVENIPLKRLPTARDIAAAYCYLASEEAGFVTGHILKVTGGISVG